MQGLGGRVEALEKEMRSGFDKVLAAVEGRAGVLREEGVEATRESERPTPQPEVRQPGQEGGQATPAEAMLSRQRKTSNQARSAGPHRRASEPTTRSSTVLHGR